MSDKKMINLKIDDKEIQVEEGTFIPADAIIINSEKNNGKSREDLRLQLENENIESRPLWKPMHLQPGFKNAPYYGGSVSEELFNNGLCLPSGSNLNSDDITRIKSVLFDKFLNM